MMTTLLDILTERLELQAPILHLYSGYRQTSSFSYCQIYDEARVRAQGFIEQGLAGTNVVVEAKTSADFIFTFFGALMAGCVTVPIAPKEMMLNEDYQTHLERLILGAGASAFIGSHPNGNSQKNFLFLTFDDLYCKGALSQPLVPEADDSCFIQFSSGSTDAPRGVVINHRSILANLRQMQVGMEVTTRDCLATWLPLYHDMGLIGGLLAPLYNMVPVHMTSPADFVAAPAKWMKFISEKKATIILGPDFSYRICVRKTTDEDRREIDLSHLRLALSGAEPVNSETCLQFEKIFSAHGLKKNVLFPVYGLAENCLGATFPRPGAPVRIEKISHEGLQASSAREPLEGEIGIDVVSCGRALPGSEVKILGPNGETLPERHVGQIWLSGPSMTSGYFKNTEATRALFLNGGLQTGDLGFVADGDLFIVGRSKDVMKVNGRSHHPPDLERKAAQVQGFSTGRLAAFSVYDFIKQTENIHLAVECRELSSRRRQLLKKKLVQKLGELVLVQDSDIHLVPPCTLPRTSSGKTKRFELRTLATQGALKKSEEKFIAGFVAYKLSLLKLMTQYFIQQKKESFLMALNDILKKRERSIDQRELVRYLSKILAEVAQVPIESIEPRRSFQEYQIDSLGLIQLTSRVQKDVAMLPLTTFIEHNTIEHLSEYLVAYHSGEVDLLLRGSKREPGAKPPRGGAVDG